MLGDGGLPSHDSRRWQSGPHLRTSLERLRAILEYLDRANIRMYRMATALAPYASHPELTQFHGQVADCEAELAEVGALARELDIRLSTHPGQYTVLNSERDHVRDAAVAELEVQASMLDAMGLGPEAVVVLHVGSGTGASVDRFVDALELLSDGARARLVIENDDRVFGVGEVLCVAERADLRVVFDLHHHHCHDPDGIEDRAALEAALATWPEGQTPKIHFSSPRLDLGADGRLPDIRAHADLIDPIAFRQFLSYTAAGLDFDVMLEAKAKDLALLRLRSHLD